MTENSLSQDFDAFVAFGRDHLASGKPAASIEDLVEDYRAQSQPSYDREQEIAAVQEAIDDYKNGDRGRPAEEVMAELKSRLQAMGE